MAISRPNIRPQSLVKDAGPPRRRAMVPLPWAKLAKRSSSPPRWNAGWILVKCLSCSCCFPVNTGQIMVKHAMPSGEHRGIERVAGKGALCVCVRTHLRCVRKCLCVFAYARVPACVRAIESAGPHPDRPPARHTFNPPVLAGPHRMFDHYLTII